MTQYFCTSLLPWVIQIHSQNPWIFLWWLAHRHLVDRHSFLLFLQWEEGLHLCKWWHSCWGPTGQCLTHLYLQRYKSLHLLPSLFMKLLAVSMFIWMLTLAKSMQNVNAQLFKGEWVEAQGRQTVEFGLLSRQWKPRTKSTCQSIFLKNKKNVSFVCSCQIR